jgi:Zn-dependent peptidase ImmA (M78 family)
MAYRRGFKTEAHALAVEVRAELGLNPLDRLDPFELADHLEIPVLPLTALRDQNPACVRHFTQLEPEAFSGVTVFSGHRRMIVYNDAHVPGRQHSDVAHELAHALLMHPPAHALDEGGCRNWNADLEDEANFLGAALLVTEEAALNIVRRGLTIARAAELYGVTPKLMQWRINATGAQKRIQRSRDYRRQRSVG